ncbi:PAS domain S-box protein [Phenylobacterium deserti]|uniref:PAS domain S-box protein n=1 Tax=Phenylobacterium deserti TaxID=1914756 RepID=UPI001403A103|nr:PAS domain S-box protein [Phenylobacterium deserti]
MTEAAGLHESEARFRALAELSPDGLVINRGGQFVYANAAAARIYGVASPADLIGRSPHDFNAPEHVARVEDRIVRLLAGEKLDPSELEIVRPDGARIAVEVNAGLITWDGEPAIEVLLRDASERKNVESALRESESRFRNMADHAPVMMWVTEPDGRCTYLNRAWYEFTGQTEADALGFGWLEATHPDDKQEVERAFVTANANRASFRVEYRLRRNDGTWRWAIDAAAPRFSDTGEYLGYVGSVIDIQDRREAEEIVRDSEVQMRTLLDAMPAIVWLAAPDGQLTYFNQRWYELTGQTVRQALPNGWTAVLHPEEAEFIADEWRTARAEQRVYEVESRYRLKNGEYRWYLIRAEPIRDESGEIVRWLGAGIDIHDRKLAAEHQSLLINELNHRVKNTLATVQSMAAQSARSAGSPKDAQETFMARLMALSAAHNVLTNERWTGAELLEVVERAAEAFGEAGERFNASGPAVRVAPKSALALSMALHELGTNASKYGALSTPEGQVSVTWELIPTEGRPLLRLVWREAGGPTVSPPKRKGFGSRLLERGLASELGGRVSLDFQPQGLVCVIEAPLEEAD